MNYQKHIVVDDSTIEKGELFRILEPLFRSVSLRGTREKYDLELSSFSGEQRLVFAMKKYLDVIGIIGHLHFFRNRTGIVWKDAVRGFYAIELFGFAQISAKAGALLVPEPSEDREERHIQLYSLNPDFDSLDAEFFALRREMDPELTIRRFIQENKAAFYYSGFVSMPK